MIDPTIVAQRKAAWQKNYNEFWTKCPVGGSIDVFGGRFTRTSENSASYVNALNNTLTVTPTSTPAEIVTQGAAGRTIASFWTRLYGFNANTNEFDVDLPVVLPQ